QFDLTLSLQESGGRVVGVLNYARDLFDRETVERWVECLQELLQGMVRDDRQLVAELPLLNERQREQVLGQFCARGGLERTGELEFELPPGLPATDCCVHELFEKQAVRTPDAVAVVYEEQSLTYEQLNSRADQLARYLTSRGVRIQDRVALWLLRSVE